MTPAKEHSRRSKAKRPRKHPTIGPKQQGPGVEMQKRQRKRANEQELYSDQQLPDTYPTIRTNSAFKPSLPPAPQQTIEPYEKPTEENGYRTTFLDNLLSPTPTELLLEEKTE